MIGFSAVSMPLFAQDDCNADLRGRVLRTEPEQGDTKYTVRFDVSAQMKCAVERFDVVVIEESQSGEKIEIRIPKKVKIKDSRSVTQKFDYRLKKGMTVADARLEQTSCKACD